MTRIIEDPATRVLIVDDNPQYAMLLERILRGALGYSNITVAPGIDEAFQVIDDALDNMFELIFVDYNFPDGRTGAEVLTYLQERGLSEGRAVFLITAEPTVENQRQALELGAAGVVVKPFDRIMLSRQLEKAKKLQNATRGEGF